MKKAEKAIKKWEGEKENEEKIADSFINIRQRRKKNNNNEIFGAVNRRRRLFSISFFLATHSYACNITKYKMTTKKKIQQINLHNFIFSSFKLILKIFLSFFLKKNKRNFLLCIFNRVLKLFNTYLLHVYDIFRCFVYAAWTSGQNVVQKQTNKKGNNKSNNKKNEMRKTQQQKEKWQK